MRRHRFHLRRDAGQETARAAQTQRAGYVFRHACLHHRQLMAEERGQLTDIATALLSAFTRSSDATPLASREPDASNDCRPSPWTSCGSISTILAFASSDMIDANKLRAPSGDAALFISDPTSAGAIMPTTRFAASGATPNFVASCCNTLSVKAPCTS